MRLGLLGAAAIAPQALVAPCATLPGVDLVTVGARDLDRARRFAEHHHIPRAVEGYQAVLDDPEVDAVYIPLPNGLHGHWTLRALEAGRHVLCEKPFTANAVEARQVAEAADSSGLVVMEAFHWRHHPLADRLVALLHEHTVGTVRHIDAAFSFPLLDPHDIRWDPDLAGGALMDAGCYPLHQIRTVGAALGLGEPEVVRAKAGFTSRGVDRNLSGELRFPDGTPATIACGFLRARRPVDIHLTVTGTHGTIHAFNPILAHLGGHLRVTTSDPVAGTVRHRQEWFGATSSYTYQLRAFRDAVRLGTPFSTTPTDAIATMELIDALLRAAGSIPSRPTPVPDAHSRPNSEEDTP